MRALNAPRPHLIAGRVVRLYGIDTVVVAGAPVVLHRVTTTHSGPLDSARSNSRGQFSFRFLPDSGAIYLVSARYAGIDYFGSPLTISPAVIDTGIIVMTSDTSSLAPLHLAARHLIVAPLNADGLRSVVDLFVLDNPGPLTKVSADTTRPVWAARLSHFAVNVQGGNSDFSASALVVGRDSIGLYSAVPPGQRDIEVDYQIPPGSVRFEVPVGEDAITSNVVSEDATMSVSPGFTRSDTVIGQKRYARWEGRMTAGQPVVLTFGASGPPRWLVPVMVIAMTLALLIATIIGARQTRALPRPE